MTASRQGNRFRSRTTTIHSDESLYREPSTRDRLLRSMNIDALIRTALGPLLSAHRRRARTETRRRLPAATWAHPRLRLLASFGTLGIAMSFVLASCAPVGFDIDVPLDEQVVPGSPLGGLLGGFFEVPIALTVDIAAETAARDTGPAKAVRLAGLYLEITTTEEPSGDTDNFDFLDQTELFVESAQSGSSLPRVRIAEVANVPKGVRRIDFVTHSDVDLLPYINEGARLSGSATGTPPPDDVSFDGVATLTIEVL